MEYLEEYIDENGKKQNRIIDLKTYSVYFLMRNGKVIYVGCSQNVKSRVSSHKSSKNFDSYVIFKSFNDKTRALNMERLCTVLLNTFRCDGLLNTQGTSAKLNSFENVIIKK